MITPYADASARGHASRRRARRQPGVARSHLTSGELSRGVDRHCPMCHITTVTPFRLTLAPGKSIFDQVVFAATRAILSGVLQPGHEFPSIRTLAADLKIHPNTAHKAVQHLIQERWLRSEEHTSELQSPCKLVCRLLLE